LSGCFLREHFVTEQIAGFSLRMKAAENGAYGISDIEG
jgi:hypothetical protein